MTDFRPLLHRYSLPLIVTVCVTLILLLGSEVESWLRFDRSTIMEGEIWRLVTGHLAHLGRSHALMNVLGLWLCWLLFGKHLKPTSSLILMLTSGVGISLGLLMFNPTLRWYVGLSGVLHAIFVYGCLMEIRAGRRDAIVLLLLIIGKLIWEQVAGPLPGSEKAAGGTVLVDAHLYGAVCGLVLMPLLTWYETRLEIRHANQL